MENRNRFCAACGIGCPRCKEISSCPVPRSLRPPRSAGGYGTTVGVQLLWLNPPALSYAASKAGFTCDFDAIGYYDNDRDRAWSQLLSKKGHYYITVDPAVHPTPPTTLDETVNQ